MRSMLVVLLITATLLCGCVSEKSSERQETNYKTERTLGSYIVGLNTAVPIDVEVNQTSNCMTIYTSQRKNYLSMCLFDIDESNDTESRLETVIQKMAWEYNWFKAGIRYKSLPKTAINGQQGIIITGNPKYEPEEILAAYYPLSGTIMVVHSTFNKQETRDILNATVVKKKTS